MRERGREEDKREAEGRGAGREGGEADHLAKFKCVLHNPPDYRTDGWWSVTVTRMT
jgi:hypothetical protein